MTTVLSIDTDSELTNLLAARLKVVGHTLVSCPDKLQLLQFVAATPLQVIIWDLDVDTEHSLIRISQLKTVFPELPIIVVSENDDPGFISVAVESGAIEYVIKPCVISMLMDKIRKWVEKTKCQV